MKRECLLVAGLTVLMLTVTALGQAAKPSPYTGVSQPPADDPIVANDDAAANANVPTAAVVTATPSTNAPAAPVVTNTVATNSTPNFAVRPLRPRSDSNAQVVTAVLSPPNELPEGTILKVILDQQLSTGTTQPGALFTGRMLENISKDGRVVVPMGATVQGRVLSVSEGRRFHGAASIRLRPDEIDLPDGTKFFLHAEVYDVSTRKANKTDSEGNILSNDNGKKTMMEGAAAAGGAAATGAMIAGVPGAIAGAVVGSSIVTAHWLFENHQAILPKNSEVIFGLTEPMSLVPLHD